MARPGHPLALIALTKELVHEMGAIPPRLLATSLF